MKSEGAVRRHASRIVEPCNPACRGWTPRRYRPRPRPSPGLVNTLVPPFAQEVKEVICRILVEVTKRPENRLQVFHWVYSLPDSQFLESQATFEFNRYRCSSLHHVL